MSRKRFKPEEIVNKLREADVLIAKGHTVAQARKRIGVSVSTNLRVAGRPQTEVDAIMRHKPSDVGSQSYTDLRAFDLFGAIECLRETTSNGRRACG